MTSPPPDPNDDLILVEEAPAAPEEIPGKAAWVVLVVDDDPEVHNATNFALQDIRIDGRPLQLIHARSGSEALQAVRDNDDIAVAILDVVMENERSGLDLVHAIRRDLGRAAMRIVLQTGQPGYAPEMRVIREYDINDYKTKSELTRVRLLTTLTTALRSYDHLNKLVAGRRALSHIVESAPLLYAQRDVAGFCKAAVDRAIKVIDADEADIFLCTHRAAYGGHSGEQPYVIVGASGRFATLVGKPLQESGKAAALVSRALERREHVHENDAAAFYVAANDAHPAVLFVSAAKPLSEGQRQLLAVYCVNIGVGLENAGLIADLSFSAYSDRLTRLANRIGFVARIDDHLRSGEKGWTMALIDIDHFSELNDALGHQKGDQLLLSVALRLSMALLPRMTLARVGGDVFGIFGPDEMLDPRQLMDHFRLPFAVGEYSLPVQATIGLVRLDEAGASDGIDLLKAANIALNRAKTGDRGRWHYYTSDMADAMRSRLDLLHDLRLAVESRRGLELHYQPQVNLASGEVVGAEALIRWRGADGNFIRPDLFISLAEYSGLIVELGAWVFHTAINELKAWDAQGIRGVHMAINVSLVQFRDPTFLSRMRAALDTAGIAPERIELEITESVAMLDADVVISTLQALKAMGIQVAIDDFGTGFSSLSYLHRLPIDRLKIDRAFVRDLGGARTSGASIAQTIIRLGQSLGLQIIAEGIETEEQAQLLADLGCPLAQGFLYSRPVDSASFVNWWHRRRDT